MLAFLKTVLAVLTPKNFFENKTHVAILITPLKNN